METEREKAIRQLQERRAARGMTDPLNRLRAHTARLIAEGQAAIVGIPAPRSHPETDCREYDWRNG